MNIVFIFLGIVIIFAFINLVSGIAGHPENCECKECKEKKLRDYQLEKIKEEDDKKIN